MATIPPSRLWQQATDEHPNDDAARRARYRDLMVGQQNLYMADERPHRPDLCVPLCGATKAYGRSVEWWHHEPQCPARQASACAVCDTGGNVDDMHTRGGDGAWVHDTCCPDC